MTEEKLIFKIIELSEKTENHEIKTITKHLVESELKTRTREIEYLTRLIRIQTDLTNQIDYIHLIKDQIDEDKKEITELEQEKQTITEAYKDAIDVV